MGKELKTDPLPVSSNHNHSHDGKSLSKEDREKLKKRDRKQRQKQNRKNKKNQEPTDLPIEEHLQNPQQNGNNDVEIEYVERDEYLLTGKYYEEFKNVFQYFATPKMEKQPTKPDYDDNYSNEDGMGNAQFEENEGGTKEQNKKTKEVKLSRKKRKQLKMLKVAQLKALVKRPDVVEVPDLKYFKYKDRLFISLLKGLGCNFTRSSSFGVSQILQKYSACPETLVPKKEVPPEQERNIKTCI